MKTKFYLLIFALFIFAGTSFAQEKIYTCINEKGERLFSIKAKYVRPFSEGMAEVEKTVLINNKAFTRSGFVDSTGALVIEPKYDEVYKFQFGVAWVKEPGATGFYLINKKGERITSSTWEKVGNFNDGISAVYSPDGKMGFVNRNGKIIAPCEYLGDGFSEGLACLMPYDEQTARYGFMDTTGTVVIPFQFNQAGVTSFENGECRVQINGVTCLINQKGEVIFKPTLTKNTMGFYDGLSASYTTADRGGWGFYNRNNVWVIKPQYDNVNDFSGGLAIVEKAGKFGLIDTLGNFVIPMQYTSLIGNGALDGYFVVELTENGESHYLNHQGKPFTSVAVKFIYPSYGSRFHAFSNPDGKYGYLNIDGTLHIAAQFEKAEPFYENKAWVKGNTESLKLASGRSEAHFVKEYVVGESVFSKKNGMGEFYPATVEQVTELYYLVKFTDETQEWVVFDSLKR